MSNPILTLFGNKLEQPLSEDEQIQAYLNEGKTIGANSKFKLDVFKTLRAADLKQRDYYDKLSDEEKKGFAPFILNRWMSIVDSNVEGMEEWYLRSTNINFNIDLLNLNSANKKHPKLQWLMMTTISPGFGVMKHQWQGYKKKTGKAVNNKTKKFLIAEFPHLKDDDIDLLMTQLKPKEIKAYAKDLGYSDKEIKKIV